jgi:hypothetical protein
MCMKRNRPSLLHPTAQGDRKTLNGYWPRAGFEMFRSRLKDIAINAQREKAAMLRYCASFELSS